MVTEVETGFEPVYTALQAVASPLGHSTEQTSREVFRADDGTRTRDPNLGKVMRYQLRYVRETPFRFSAKRCNEAGHYRNCARRAKPSHPRYVAPIVFPCSG